MDWQPTVASATNQRRAKLVSKQEMEKRKQQNRCFRCGGSGHRINQCPYLPPKSPAHVATANSHEPELEDEESLAEDTGMEGKE
jgi:zinc knuckle protein